MSSLTQFTLAGGTTVLVESDTDIGPYDDDTAPIARGRAGAVRASTELPEALSQVRAVIDSTLDGLTGLDISADEMEISFGVRLSGQVGAVVTKVGAESNLTVRLLWKKPE